MKELVQTVDAWLAEGVQVGRAVVLRTYGSSPRPEGSVLLYAADGRIAGSVSGGCVEGSVAQEIDAARSARRARVVHYGITDELAWGVGLACGGALDVLVEPEVPREAIDAAHADGGSVVITRLPDAQPEGTAQRLIFELNTSLRGSTGDAAADQALEAEARAALERRASRVAEVAGDEYFLEVFAPRARLVIVGAVEIARPLVRIAHELDFETVVVDARASFATRERFPDADALIPEWPDEAAQTIDLGPDDAVVVLTHDPKFDEPAIKAALRRGCWYVGAIGSRKTQAERRERLREQGVSDVDLARVHGPIGLDLGGRGSAEIALAIAAEIVAAGHDASGGSLRGKSAALAPAGTGSAG